MRTRRVAWTLPPASRRVERERETEWVTRHLTHGMVTSCSPGEALSPLMLDAPSNYDEVASFFGVLGLRVLALAWKALSLDVTLARALPTIAFVELMQVFAVGHMFTASAGF